MRTPSRPNQELRAIGRHFGYPSCCIHSFCEVLDAGGHPAEASGDGPWTGTGFVPCEDHVATIRKIGMAEFVSNYITPNRRHRVPFGPGATLGDKGAADVLRRAKV